MTTSLVIGILVAVIVIGLTVQFVRERNSTVRERDRADLHHAKLSNFEAAFASSAGRGELGEAALLRTVAAAGLIEGVHFHLQRESSGSSQGRPDLTLVLGNDRHMMVDSKCVIAPYWDALDAADDKEQKSALNTLVQSVRKHATELRGRQYDSAGNDLTGVILFVPTDAVATAAISTDPTLWQYLAAKNILLSGPTGLLLLANCAHAATAGAVIDANLGRIASFATQAVNEARATIQSFDKANKQLNQSASNLAAGHRHLGTLTAALNELSGIAGVGVSIDAPKPIKAAGVSTLDVASFDDDLVD